MRIGLFQQKYVKGDIEFGCLVREGGEAP